MILKYIFTKGQGEGVEHSTSQPDLPNYPYLVPIALLYYLKMFVRVN